MKYLIIIILISFTSYSQDLIVPDCGMTIKHDTTIEVDNLILNCNSTVLLQDNAILIINGEIINNEYLAFKYGDYTAANDTIKDRSQLVKLPRTDLDGNIFYDYRDSTAVNPVVIFNMCIPEDLDYGNYININLIDVPICSESNLAIKEHEYSDIELADKQCIIHNFLGQELYKGKFKDRPIIYNIILLIKVQIAPNKIYYIKRVTVK